MVFKFLFCTFILFPCLLYSYDISSERKNKFTVKVAEGFSDEVKRLLKRLGFHVSSEITPETFVVQFIGEGNGTGLMAEVARNKKHKIVEWEPVRVYTDTIKPAYVESKDRSLPENNLVCFHNYGMGVEDVWKAGYTGKNIKIAVTDVGINTDRLDFKNNLNTAWSYNYVQNNCNVTSTYYPDPANNLRNQGNMVASVLAAEEDNEIRAACIAYNATIVALKVFEVVNSSQNNYSLELQSVTTGDTLSRAFLHRFKDIDIFVSPWCPTTTFFGSDLSTMDAIKRGAKKGRRGLGKIYVVPSGTPGSNSIYTVTVGSVGINGSLMSDIHRFVDASILVSALSEGNNLTSARRVTTSYQDRCFSSFKGLSAAAAQIGGIIALGLQANEYLSLRDVQHLLVISAEHDCLTERNNFKANGAGLYYHDSLGFGLIDPLMFVRLAKVIVGYPRRLKKRLNMKHDREFDTRTSKMNEVDFCYHCQDLDDEDCITSVEHVSANIAMTVNTNKLSVTILSPRGTQSTLIQESKRHSAVNGTFVSTHFWNEAPVGKWKIILKREHVKDTVQDLTLSLTLYGFHDKQTSSPSELKFCGKKSMVIASGINYQLDKNNKINMKHYNIYGFLCALLVVVLRIVIAI